MRLDLVLKKSGLIKRRVIAKELVEKELVLVNDKSGKPSQEIKENDVLQLHLGNHLITVKVHFSIRNNQIIPFVEEISNEKISQNN